MNDPIVVGGDIYLACPAHLLDQAAVCADLDARAIVRVIWPHFLEAMLAGVAPFTLEAAP